jgi:hypothetical protein
MADSPDSRSLSQDGHDSSPGLEKRPYAPPAIEHEEEFERVMLACQCGTTPKVVFVPQLQNS